MLTLPFPNHFDWDKHDFNQDELSLKQTEELFAKIDEQLWNECNKSEYKSYRFRQHRYAPKPFNKQQVNNESANLPSTNLNKSRTSQM